MKWLGLGVGAALAAACVLPQSDDYIAQKLPFPNHPPRILETTLEPSQPVVPVQNGANCSIRFRVQVEDFDLQDRLRVYWYVDYFLNGRSAEEVDLLDSSPTTVRQTSVTYDVTMNAPGNPLATVGNHVVEALVSDGEVLDRRTGLLEGRNDFPDGGPPTFFVIKPWFVQVEAGDCP
jgi:hypothetical protein